MPEQNEHFDLPVGYMDLVSCIMAVSTNPYGENTVSGKTRGDCNEASSVCYLLPWSNASKSAYSCGREESANARIVLGKGNGDFQRNYLSSLMPLEITPFLHKT